MQGLKRITMAACVLIAAAVLGIPHQAQAQEPHYLDALSALRTARDYIQSDPRPQFGHERKHAVDEINKAIDEIKHAAWDDGKNTKYAPPTAAMTDPWAPIHQGLNWLAGAEQAVKAGMDTPQNQGLRERAVFHMEEARHTLLQFSR